MTFCVAYWWVITHMDNAALSRGGGCWWADNSCREDRPGRVMYAPTRQYTRVYSAFISGLESGRMLDVWQSVRGRLKISRSRACGRWVRMVHPFINLHGWTLSRGRLLLWALMSLCRRPALATSLRVRDWSVTVSSALSSPSTWHQRPGPARPTLTSV